MHFLTTTTWIVFVIAVYSIREGSTGITTSKDSIPKMDGIERTQKLKTGQENFNLNEQAGLDGNVNPNIASRREALWEEQRIILVKFEKLKIQMRLERESLNGERHIILAKLENPQLAELQQELEKQLLNVDVGLASTEIVTLSSQLTIAKIAPDGLSDVDRKLISRVQSELPDVAEKLGLWVKDLESLQVRIKNLEMPHLFEMIDLLMKECHQGREKAEQMISVGNK